MANVSADALVEIIGARTRVVRYVNIHNSDGTIWKERVPLLDGSVNVDENASERRMIEATIQNVDGELDIDPINGLWYDKIVKPYRGVLLDDDTEEVWQLGSFLIDQLEEQDFPKAITLTGRDRTKTCKQSKFALATLFRSGIILETLIKNIAANAGITNIVFPVTGVTLTREFMFDAGTSRWDAMTELATAYGYELFFSANEYLVMRKITDPNLDPISWTFETGEFSTVAGWKRRSKDDRLYNVVQVTGESANGPVCWAEARNENPSSPTNIDRVGERVYPYTSAFITTEEQAQELADALLAVMSLESWELELETLVFPWLEAGEVVEFTDDDTTRWRLSSFSVPLGLSTMNLSARRLEIVG